MREFNLERLPHNPRIRSCEIQGITYFSVIDVLAELRETDFRTAQNYYHVVKNRINKNGLIIPDLKQIKARTVNRKFYFSDFTTKHGISVLVDYLTPNLDKEQYRVDIRQDDERVNFHPQVIAFFEARGWRVEHHVKLSLGSQVDVIATFNDEIPQTIFVVECKPRLSRQHFYTAVGQVLCYCAEYGKTSFPVIATYSSQIDDYIMALCHSLGIRLLAVDKLEYATITYNKAIGFDLVTEKPLLPQKTKK